MSAAKASATGPSKRLIGRAILVAGGIAGTLDILTAFVQAWIANRVAPDVVLKYIAGGVFGLRESLRGGWEMAAAGLLFHFVIAYSLAAFFVVLYLNVRAIRDHLIPAGFAYGVFAWVVTTRLIIPYISRLPARPFDTGKAVTAIVILMVMVGTPIALITNHYLRRSLRGPHE